MEPLPTDIRPDTPDISTSSLSAKSTTASVPSAALRASNIPASIHCPSETSKSSPFGTSKLSVYSLVFLTITLRSSPSSVISTSPSISDMNACPLGDLTSNSSSTLGRPLVISTPATPPVWKVLMVSCVPGSPIL